MTCVHFQLGDITGIMTVGDDYKPGDPAPQGYLQWQEWAEVQHKAGLRQRQCGHCSKWFYPQELSENVYSYQASNRRGQPVRVEYRRCLSCAAAA